MDIRALATTKTFRATLWGVRALAAPAVIIGGAAALFLFEPTLPVLGASAATIALWIPLELIGLWPTHVRNEARRGVNLL